MTQLSKIMGDVGCSRVPMCGCYNVITDAQALLNAYDIAGELLNELTLPTYNEIRVF